VYDVTPGKATLIHGPAELVARCTAYLSIAAPALLNGASHVTFTEAMPGVAAGDLGADGTAAANTATSTAAAEVRCVVFGEIVDGGGVVWAGCVVDDGCVVWGGCVVDDAWLTGGGCVVDGASAATVGSAATVSTSVVVGPGGTAESAPMSAVPDASATQASATVMMPPRRTRSIRLMHFPSKAGWVPSNTPAEATQQKGERRGASNRSRLNLRRQSLEWRRSVGTMRCAVQDVSMNPFSTGARALGRYGSKDGRRRRQRVLTDQRLNLRDDDPALSRSLELASEVRARM
jgi:hypothetical protein